jgi:hypothetical protein
MRGWWLCLIAGCQSGDAPRAQPAPVATRDAAVIADAVVDAKPVIVDARLPPPANEVLAAIPMAGPFATRANLCAAQPCAPDTWGIGVPVTLACPSELPAEIEGTRMAEPPAMFTEVFLQAIQCETAAFDGTGAYHVVVHRADGYYLSAPIVTVNSNPKYCEFGLAASWQMRDGAILLGVAAHSDCVSCNKQGLEANGVELLAVIANGAVPVTFAPLVTAQHHHQKPQTWMAPGTDCPVEDREVTLAPALDLGVLTLRGAATWKRPVIESDGSIAIGAFEIDPPVASSAGRYRLALP